MNNSSSRRDFLATISKGTACALCYAAVTSAFSGCGDPVSAIPDTSVPLTDGDPVIDLSKETGLANTGNAVKKRWKGLNGGKTIIIVRTSAATFAAFAAQCTHQGSEIGLPSNSMMLCPSHGSKFNASTGAVIQGPAAKPLPSFTATYTAATNSVIIS